MTKKKKQRPIPKEKKKIKEITPEIKGSADAKATRPCSKPTPLKMRPCKKLEPLKNNTEDRSDETIASFV